MKAERAIRFTDPPVDRALALEGLVRGHADQSERDRRLHPAVAEAFAAAGLYRIAAPRDCFGEEAPPLEQIETIEAISRFDGASGWNLMIGIETFGLVAPGFEHCRDLIEDPLVVLCSSTTAVGRADPAPGGYRISGQWPFVSGCHNAIIFCATVDLPEIGLRYAVVPEPDYEIIDTWRVGGLRGSGSHDVRVEGAFVPEERITAPIGGAASECPLLRFPLGARLAYNKVAVAFGLARAAMDAFVALAEGKTPRFTSAKLCESPHAQRAAAEAEVRLQRSRALVMEQVDKLWAVVQAAGHITTRERALFQLACSDAVRDCAEAVDLIAEAAGTTANKEGHPLERISRDIRVVRQHTTVAGHNLLDTGRVLLGLKPQSMMLAGGNRP